MATVDPTSNPEAVKLDADGNPIPDGPPSVITEEVMLDMKNVFSVFDLKNEDKVPISELRTIMRALDVNVQEDMVVEILRKTIDPDNTGYITFARLTVVMEEKLKDSDTAEDLIKQLEKLDRDNDGKIPTPEFKQYMLNLGNKMTAEEVEELVKFVDPKNEGAIDIAEMADALCPPKS